MTGPAPARPYEQREFLYVSIAKVLALPLFFSFQLIAEEPIDTGIWIVAVPSTIYVFSMLWIASSEHWARVPPWFFIVGDLIAIAIGVPLTGGAGSDSLILFLAWIVSISLLLPPRMVLVCLALAMLTFAAAAVVTGPGLTEEDVRELAFAEISLAWVGLLTYFAADVFRRRQERIGRLSEARRSLLADALTAEDRARRRLSQSLHDDALQTLLAAGQDLDAGTAGDREQLDRGREEVRSAVRALRKTIRGLHPAALEHGGLAGGLDAVTESAADRAGFAVDLRVDPEAAGHHDALIVSVVRELVTNSAKHAEASRLSVHVDREGSEIAVAVADDGRGMADSSRDAALSAGHIGLASAQERVEAAGGRMRVLSAPDRGTTIELVLFIPDVSVNGAEMAKGLAEGRAR